MATKKRTFDAISEYRNTSVRYDETGYPSECQLYDTVIFQSYPDGMVRLDHGGHKTRTTKRRMNECLAAAGSHKRVIQRDYSWYVTDKDGNKVASWSSDSSSVRVRHADNARARDPHSPDQSAE